MKPPAVIRAFEKLLSSSVVWMCLALGAVDCTSDHDRLARRPGVSGAAGAGGTAGNGGAAGKGASGKSGASGSSAASGGSGGVKPVEPPGRAVTTLLHGVVDAERIAWCFGRGAEAPELFGRPTPRSGVAYGQAFTFEALDDVDLDDVDLTLYALAGELELVRELDCEEAVTLARREMTAAAAAGTGGSGAGGAVGEGGAPSSGGASDGGAGQGQAGEPGASAGGAAGGAGEGGETGVAGGSGAPSEGGAGGEGPSLPPPARLRFGTVATFPRGTLGEGYSLLLVATGCIGGSAFADPDAGSICGEGYDPTRGNLSANVVVLSRKTSPSALALQALHASRASQERGVRVTPQGDVLPVISIAEGITEGTLRPREPRLDLGTDDYGVGLSGWALEVNAAGTPVFEESWADVLERGGIEELEPGRGYTLVLIGPAAGAARSWWNGSVLTIVDNDPGGGDE